MEARERLAQIKERIAAGVDEREAKALTAEITSLLNRVGKARWQPYPWQVAPQAVPTMGTWLMLGGRGTGKTEGSSRYFDDHMNGPACDARIKGGHRAAIVAPTLGDAAESCVQGPSGLQTINPGVTMKGGVGGVHAIWPSGAQARLFGAFTTEDVERLRAGGNRCLVWMEEAAAMRFLGPALEHTALGLRVGRHPHYVMSTTPKPRKELRALVSSPRTIVTRGSTRDAVHLDRVVREVLFERYEGTRLGRQELDAELLGDVEGALWSEALIERNKSLALPNDLDRIVVGVDPPGVKRPGRECGIVVVGRGASGVWVLGDHSGSYSPSEWGAEVVQAYRSWNANSVIAERNYGGDMVREVISHAGQEVHVVEVVSKIGKELRAEPVVALYEQGKVHHFGSLPDLEQQMTEWVPGSGESPDRLDALVHAITHLAVGPQIVTVHSPVGYRREGNVLTPDFTRVQNPLVSMGIPESPLPPA